MRIYSNYSQIEANDIKKMAEEMGITPSSLQEYAVCLYVYRDLGNRNSDILALPNLIELMMAALNRLPSGSEFNIAQLFLPYTWTNLTPSTKRTLACKLKREIESNPSKYQIILQQRGETNRYRVK